MSHCVGPVLGAVCVSALIYFNAFMYAPLPVIRDPTKEFPMLSLEYYNQAVATGRLRVESSSCFPHLAASRGAAAGQGEGGGRGKGGVGWAQDRPLRAGMCIRHFIHRHEPPVVAGDVEVRAVWRCGFAE